MSGAPQPWWEAGTACTHWARHTVYGAADPERNGTWCQLCGKKLASPDSRKL